MTVSIQNEIEGMTDSQAVRHLAISIDRIEVEVGKIRTLLTTVALLLFTATISLIGVFLSIILG